MNLINAMYILFHKIKNSIRFMPALFPSVLRVNDSYFTFDTTVQPTISGNIISNEYNNYFLH